MSEGTAAHVGPPLPFLSFSNNNLKFLHFRVWEKRMARRHATYHVPPRDFYFTWNFFSFLSLHALPMPIVFRFFRDSIRCIRSYCNSPYPIQLGIG